ncbi:MAG: glycosyltransferase [Chloroflexi bacterium]|nr:glycosyltransferase [Chloroflexota bacterium]
MRPIKILYLITELDVGGAQQALFRLLSGLDRQRFQPVVACFFNGRRQIGQQIQQLDIRVVDLGMQPKWRFDALWRLGRLICREKPKILHCWLFHANFLGRIVGWLKRVPIIITSRRNVEIGGAWRDYLIRWTTSLDMKVVAVCEAARQAEIERSRVAPDKVVTIYNGVNIELYNVAARQAVRQEFGIGADALLLGVVGRLHAQKGHSYLFEALRDVRRHLPDVRLLIVGDGRLRSELEAIARQKRVEDAIIFTGSRRDIPELLSAMDLFALPSLWEGLPNAVLEAMAAGLPVVATAVGGAPELVVPGETGLLVPPGDAQALAQAIRLILEDSVLAQSMGSAGRQRVRSQFDIAVMQEKMVGLYGRLLQEKGLS